MDSYHNPFPSQEPDDFALAVLTHAALEGYDGVQVGATAVGVGASGSATESFANAISNQQRDLQHLTQQQLPRDNNVRGDSRDGIRGGDITKTDTQQTGLFDGSFSHDQQRLVIGSGNQIWNALAPTHETTLDLNQNRNQNQNQNQNWDENLSGNRMSSTTTTTTLGYTTTRMGTRTAMGRNTESYMDSAYPAPGSQIQNSRAYGGNSALGLGILSAETYDEGVVKGMGRDRRMEGYGFEGEKTGRRNVEGGENSKSGKRAKKGGKKRVVEIISVDAEEEGEGEKKARGRPRVDTKDETAADRRRTQIRMAQRAYRHRKETTISSLEKKVQDLRGTNEEMSNIFISLYDFAVGRSLLQREPEFGQQLQSATERFLALAKQSAEDLNQEDGSEDHERHDSIPEDLEPPKKKGRRSPPKARQEPTPPTLTETPPWGGYRIDHSNSPIQELQPEFQPQIYPERTRHGDLQVITRPTEDNASFSFEFMDLQQPIQQYRVEVPPIDDWSQFFYPQSQLPLPKTNAYQEISFARRLTRSALEGALRLAMQETPNPIIWKRAFGFSNQYEKKEAIKARLLRRLAATTNDTLQNWQAPFTHVGGAGTFYPWDNTHEDLLPRFRTGYSMGPFTSEVTQVEESLDDDMHCKMPGWEGEFFDANDVEGYLKSRGLDIPGSADTVTAQIDLAVISELGESNSPSDSSGSSTTGTGVGVSPLTPENPGDVGMQMYSLDPKKLDSEAYPFPLAESRRVGGRAETRNGVIEPLFFALAEREYAAESASTKRTITLNVGVLVDQMVRRATCLGRTPGFRLSDVNAAIVAAVTAGS